MSRRLIAACGAAGAPSRRVDGAAPGQGLRQASASECRQDASGVSILFDRMLKQAESSLAAGAHGEAETICCQVLTGAATLCNVPLSQQSASLLRRIPAVDDLQRRAAIW